MTGDFVPNNVLTAGQTQEANDFMSVVFNALVDFIYSIFITVVNFVTTPQVLWTLVTLAILWFFYAKIRRKVNM